MFYFFHTAFDHEDAKFHAVFIKDGFKHYGYYRSSNNERLFIEPEFKGSKPSYATDLNIGNIIPGGSGVLKFVDGVFVRVTFKQIDWIEI